MRAEEVVALLSEIPQGPGPHTALEGLLADALGDIVQRLAHLEQAVERLQHHRLPGCHRDNLGIGP